MRVRRPSSRSVSSWALAVVLAYGPAKTSAHAAADALPGRRIDQLAAGPSRLFALRGGEVVTFDDGGEALGRCGNFTAPPRREARTLLGAPDAEEVLQAAGLPDDDNTPDAEDALEDEGLGPRRRTHPAPDIGVEPHALAAARSADLVWVATSSGIFRGDESGCTTAGLEGRDLLLVATAGGVVVAASEYLLFRRETEKWDSLEGGDDTATFTVTAGLASRPRALAIGPDHETIVADDDGVLIVGRDNAATRIFDRPTDAIAVCGNVAAVLSSDGVYTWSPGVAPVRVGDRPPARALACGRSADERWIATGVGVWTSADGATWVERHDMLGRSVAGAAVLGDRLWLAADDGLVALDAFGTAEDQLPRTGSPTLGRPLGAGFPELPTRRLIAPRNPWPWVTAAFGTERTPDRHAWSVMLLLTFPLGRAAARRIDPTSVANELVERDLALASEQAELRNAPTSDEVDARLAATQQEREALR